MDIAMLKYIFSKTKIGEVKPKKYYIYIILTPACSLFLGPIESWSQLIFSTHLKQCQGLLTNETEHTCSKLCQVRICAQKRSNQTKCTISVPLKKHIPV